MEIIYESKTEKTVKDIKDIPTGTVFKAIMFGSHSSVFLKEYEGIVDLQNPDLRWNAEGGGKVLGYIELNAKLIVSEKGA